jgi:hypothetical protein
VSRPAPIVHYLCASSLASAAAADPRIVTVNQVAAKGVTPLAKNFGQTFNDPNGPWLVLTRDALFNGADSSKLDADNVLVVGEVGASDDVAALGHDLDLGVVT